MPALEFDWLDYLAPVFVALIFVLLLLIISFCFINFFCVTKYDDLTVFEKVRAFF